MFWLLADLGWVNGLVFQISLGGIALFLILLILVQRGRGGGLTGALGGMGGQSAFGTKAGDVFTRVTIVVAACWILLSMAVLKVSAGKAGKITGAGTGAAIEPADKKDDKKFPDLDKTLGTAPSDDDKKDDGKKEASAEKENGTEKATTEEKSTTDDKSVPAEKTETTPEKTEPAPDKTEDKAAPAEGDAKKE
jgi:preprotein translocase subunit SecG